MAKITFIGGEETGNVGLEVYENRMIHGARLEFPLNKPVEVDPDTATGDLMGFYLHVIRKAKINRFFKVEDDRNVPLPAGAEQGGGQRRQRQ
jgi:hypothetical protein